MARKKTITRDDILNAAFKVVANEGFAHFTARNVASKVGSSTQPIYLEFKNMQDLREAVFNKIYYYLEDEVFSVSHTGDAIVDLGLNYIHFAQNEKKLYYALYLDDATDGERMLKFSWRYFVKFAMHDEKYASLPKEELSRLHIGTWTVATGIASLMSSGIISPTDDEIIKMIEAGISSIEAIKTPIILKDVSLLAEAEDHVSAD